MKKTYLLQLQKMLEDPTIKGKGWIRNLIWRNTVKAKYKVGDHVIFSDPSQYTYGNRVIEFAGVIKDVKYWPDDQSIHYGVDFIVVADGKETTCYACPREDKVFSKTRKTKNVVKKLNPNSQYTYL